MEMMTPDRQKVNPYFTGGEVISISFPTDTMSHEDKLMSMRGNNIHFSRATVHHELIPGHHLQGFMAARYRTHRRAFRTPFLIEGWALYWEMLLWDLNFPRSIRIVVVDSNRSRTPIISTRTGPFDPDGERRLRSPHIKLDGLLELMAYWSGDGSANE